MSATLVTDLMLISQQNVVSYPASRECSACPVPHPWGWREQLNAGSILGDIVPIKACSIPVDHSTSA